MEYIERAHRVMNVVYRRWARANGAMKKNSMAQRMSNNKPAYRATGNLRRTMARAAHYDPVAREGIRYQNGTL